MHYLEENLAVLIAKGFLKGIVKVISMIVLAVVLALGAILLFIFTSHWLSGYKEYIFYLTPGTSMFIAFAVIYFWFFVFFYRIGYKKQMKRDVLTNDSNHIEIDNLKPVYKVFQFYDDFKFKKQIIGLLLLLSAAGLFYSYTTYNVITENNIIVHNPVHLSGKIYSYSDVNEISTGISSNKDTNLYYILKLNDGTKINVTSGGVATEYENNELAISYIDQKLIKNGVKKNIDTKNLEKFERKGYDKEYVENVKKILQ